MVTRRRRPGGASAIVLSGLGGSGTPRPVRPSILWGRRTCRSRRRRLRGRLRRAQGISWLLSPRPTSGGFSRTRFERLLRRRGRGSWGRGLCAGRRRWGRHCRRLHPRGARVLKCRSLLCLGKLCNDSRDCLCEIVASRGAAPLTMRQSNFIGLAAGRQKLSPRRARRVNIDEQRNNLEPIR